MTGACKLENPSTIILANGITAKLYGPWLRAEHGDSLPFFTASEDGALHSQHREMVKGSNILSVQQRINCQSIERRKQVMVLEGSNKSKSLEDPHAALEICPELNSLNQIAASNGGGNLNKLYVAMLHQARIPNFDP